MRHFTEHVAAEILGAAQEIKDISERLRRRGKISRKIPIAVWHVYQSALDCERALGVLLEINSETTEEIWCDRARRALRRANKNLKANAAATLDFWRLLRAADKPLARRVVRRRVRD